MIWRDALKALQIDIISKDMKVWYKIQHWQEV